MEQKRVAKERKARRNKNFDLIQDVTGLWEQLRRHDTSAARRSELVSAILAKINGRVADLAGSHTASRVVQACVKYGTTEERSAILKQLEPKLLDLAKSPYGRFVVSKLIDVGGKDTLKGGNKYNLTYTICLPPQLSQPRHHRQRMASDKQILRYLTELLDSLSIREGI